MAPKLHSQFKGKINVSKHSLRFVYKCDMYPVTGPVQAGRPLCDWGRPLQNHLCSAKVSLTVIGIQDLYLSVKLLSKEYAGLYIHVRLKLLTVCV